MRERERNKEKEREMILYYTRTKIEAHVGFFFLLMNLPLIITQVRERERERERDMMMILYHTRTKIEAHVGIFVFMNHPLIITQGGGGGGGVMEGGRESCIVLYHCPLSSPLNGQWYNTVQLYCLCIKKFAFWLVMYKTVWYILQQKDQYFNKTWSWKLLK